MSSKPISAQLQLYEVYEKVEKPGQKPKNSITLNEAKIDSNYTNPSQGAYSTAMVVPDNANLSVSPSTTPSSTGSHSGSGIVGSNGSGSGVVTSGMHMFTIITQTGEVHEFRTETENDRLRWVKLLQLLVMFPFSSIPEEPVSDPIKKLFQGRLDPKQYKAGECASEWAGVCCFLRAHECIHLHCGGLLFILISLGFNFL